MSEVIFNCRGEFAAAKKKGGDHSGQKEGGDLSASMAKVSSNKSFPSGRKEKNGGLHTMFGKMGPLNERVEQGKRICSWTEGISNFLVYSPAIRRGEK